MHGLRFEYERDGQDVIVTARVENDQGHTWSSRVRATGIAVATDPTLAIAENAAVARLREFLG